MRLRVCVRASLRVCVRACLRACVCVHLSSGVVAGRGRQLPDRGHHLQGESGAVQQGVEPQGEGQRGGRPEPGQGQVRGEVLHQRDAGRSGSVRTTTLGLML